MDLSNLKFEDIKQNYILPDTYIFYAANTWKHKNHINLIRALEVVHSRYSQNVHLVCTGEKYKEFFPKIEKQIINSKLEEYIRFLGYIPEDEMLQIMTNATLVVIPTSYEAGSIPLIEAMNYGVPVICSNVTSLPQQIGDDRFVFDPNDIEAMALKINMMLGDQNLREENTKNSRKQIKNLNWQSKVDGFADSYQKAVNRFAGRKNDFFKAHVNNFEFFINDFYMNSIENYQQQINEYQKCIQQEKQLSDKLQAKIEQMQTTLSWRVTAPLCESTFVQRLLQRVK